MENPIPDPDKVVYKSCSFCGRTFNPSSLERHEKICEKTKLKQRKVFDSFQQRAKDLAVAPVKPSKQEENKKLKGKWKAQHEELIKAVRSEKNATTLKEGRPQQKVIPLGYIQCPVCRRCFNHKAADRHISWCQEQLSRLPKSPACSEAMMRLKARIQYRAPLPGKRRIYSVDGQRLIKSAESFKSTVQRTHSSPCTSSSTPNIKHVAFQTQPALRRRSCERSTFNESSTEVFKSNTLPSKSSLRAQPSPNMSVKFKEKFPNYSSRVSYDCYTREDDNDMYFCEESMPTLRRNENLDILKALRLQFAELRASDRCNDNNLNHRNTHLSLPSMSGKCVANFPAVDEAHHSSSSGSDGSLPSMNVKLTLPRMPRFCYNCGTKYPVLSAKYCCECGAKRLVLGPNNDSSPVY